MALLVFSLDDDVGMVSRWWKGWTVAMLGLGGKSEDGVEGREEVEGEETVGGLKRSRPPIRSRCRARLAAVGAAKRPPPVGVDERSGSAEESIGREDLRLRREAAWEPG